MSLYLELLLCHHPSDYHNGHSKYVAIESFYSGVHINFGWIFKSHT